MRVVVGIYNRKGDACIYICIYFWKVDGKEKRNVTAVVFGVRIGYGERVAEGPLT